MVSAERCFNLLNIPQENIDGQKNLEAVKENDSNWPMNGEIEFKNVFLKYRPTTEYALKGLNFKA